MSIPHDSPQPAAPPGWYPTGETGPDGAPVERWWDGGVWSAMVRPLGGGTFGPPSRGRSPRAKALIATATVVVLAAVGASLYFGLHHSSPSNTNAQPNTQSTGNQGGNGLGGLGGGNGGQGNGNGSGGLGGGNGGLGSTPAPQPTVTGGSGTTVSDPINSLTVPVPSGWVGTSGSADSGGSWPVLSTGSYTCPSGMQSGSSSGPQTCTRGGVSFTTVEGTDAKSGVESNIAKFAKYDYGNLSAHSVVNESAITVAGRSGYQITWTVTPSYSGPSGTVQLIAVPDPAMPGYLAVIDIGVDKSSQAPSLSSVDSQIIGNIVDSSAAGA